MRRGGTWLHGAAYAERRRLSGASSPLPAKRADSVGMNPHKWLGVRWMLSALTRRQDEFRRAFSLVPLSSG